MISAYTAKYTKISSGYMSQLVDWPEVVTEGKTLEECRLMLEDALREMIESKIAGKQVVSVQEEEKPVIDIMTALKQSIERTKAQKKPMEKAKGAKKEAVEAVPAKQKKQKVA